MTRLAGSSLLRLLDRREVTALLEAFVPLASGVDLALVGIDGRWLAGTGEWSSEELADAWRELVDAGGLTPEIDAGKGWVAYPLPSSAPAAGALLVRHRAAIDDRQIQALAYLRRSLEMLVAQSLAQRSLAQETLERYREISLLHSVGETIIACLDPQELPARMLEEAGRAISSDAGAVFLIDPAGEQLGLQASYNLQPADDAVAVLARRAAGDTLAEGQARIDNDLPRASDSAWARALLSVPLRTPDRVLGAIVLLRGEAKGMFTAGEERLLNALATQTAIALENARLYAMVGQALEKREGQLSTVEEIARELNAALNLERVMDLVVRRCLEATSARCGAIALVEEGGALLVLSPQGFADGLPAHLQELARQVIATGRAASAEGDHLVVPIVLDLRPMGAVLLADAPGGLGTEDETFIRHLSEHAAIAIRNARLYEAAEQERSKLSAILVGTSEAIIVVDDNGSVLMANPAAARFLAVDLGEAPGRRLEEIAQSAGLVDLLKRVSQEKRSLSGEIVGPADRVSYGSVSPVPGIGWVAVLQDISYLKELDELRSEFLATVSQDLKSPISLVMGYAEIIAQAGELSATQREFLDQIVRASQNMTGLINQLLDIVQIEAGFLGQMVRCDLAKSAHDVVAQMRYQAQTKGVTLKERIGKKTLPVRGVSYRLSQAVTILVQNALQFTPSGGRIAVTAHARKGEVILEVQDSGIGIAPQDLERVFERFYRTDEANRLGVGGNGLGLAICKGIVEKHGGRIWVDSKLGKGSVFRIALPMVGAP